MTPTEISQLIIDLNDIGKRRDELMDIPKSTIGRKANDIYNRRRLAGDRMFDDAEDNWYRAISELLEEGDKKYAREERGLRYL